MAEFKMPSLGADMEQGTLVEWKKKPGETINRGNIIAVVETAKGVIEIECFQDGILDEIFFQPGQDVPVGQVLATICSPEEYKAKPAGGAPKPVEMQKPPEITITQPEKPAAPVAVAVAQAPAPVAAPAAVSSDRIKISPLASKVALELGVDFRTVKGTGPGGAIQRAVVAHRPADEWHCCRSGNGDHVPAHLDDFLYGVGAAGRHWLYGAGRLYHGSLYALDGAARQVLLAAVPGHGLQRAGRIVLAHH